MIVDYFQYVCRCHLSLIRIVFNWQDYTITLIFFKIRRGLWLSANFKSKYSCTTFIDVYFNYLCDMKYETLKWLFLFWWDKILDTTNFISPSPYKKIIYRNKTTQVFRKTDSKKKNKNKNLVYFHTEYDS